MLDLPDTEPKHQQEDSKTLNILLQYDMVLYHSLTEYYSRLEIVFVLCEIIWGISDQFHQAGPPKPYVVVDI